jgi:enoyl-CoA hydratase/carnithine racemase
MATQETNVRYEVTDGAAIVRLDRPARLNAFTFQMIAEIRAAVDRAIDDDHAVGIVITGTGRAFSAGLDAGDLARSAAGAAPRAEPVRGELPALFGYLLKVPKPVIAAINGVAAGGGFVLAMMSDLRFAATDATFTTAFSKRGLIAEHGTSWLLPRIVGNSRALDLLWSSRRFDAAEALRIGFVDRVVEPAQLMDSARQYLRDLAASVSPRSLAVMKSQIYRHWSMDLESALRDADSLMNEALAHPDATEGVASFVERRPPRFAPLRGGKA